MFLGALAAAAIASGTPKTEPASEVVQVGEVSLRVPFPAGYCPPEGLQKSVFQQLAAMDGQNVSLLSLDVCGGKDPHHRYLVLKAPIRAMNTTVDRTAIINEVSQEADQSDTEAKLKDTSEAVGAAKTSATGVDTKIAIQNQTHSHDDVCFYFAATMTTSSSNASEVQAMTGCMTVVGGKLISLYAFEDTPDLAAPKKLIPLLRQWALSIKAVQ